MYKGKKIYVMYRLLYGEQFLKESIESVLDYVDKVFIFWTDAPFGGVHCVEYNDELIYIPKKIDNAVEKAKEINSEKIVITKKHYRTNQNQFTLMYNRDIAPIHGTCDVLMMMEPDHVFREDQIQLALDEFIDKKLTHATTEQWEIWKGFKHCVPQWLDEKINPPEANKRFRLCTMFWNTSHYRTLPQTGTHCNGLAIEPFRLKARTHNFGFAWNYKTQYWKHLISIGISERIKDNPPNHNWLNDKWVTWDYENNNSNLEQSIGYEHWIPKIIPYDHNELPDSVKDNLGDHIKACFNMGI